MEASKIKMHPILMEILRRLFLGLITLFVVSLIFFFSRELLPGDFPQTIYEETGTEAVAAYQRELGLDQPVYLRYFDWLGSVMQGDLGTAYSDRDASGFDRSRPVYDLIAGRMWNSAFLALMAACIAIPLALFLGITTTLFRNSFYDKIINTFALISISIPEYLIAYILILVFSVFWPVLPSIAIVNPDMDLGERMYRCALPALTLTLVITANMMRMTRALLIGVLANSYIEMAQLKGLSKTKVILRHALPNAWGAIATVISFNLAYLFVGVVVVEVVFAYPGIGQLMVDAVFYRDMPVVQGCALIFAITYIVINLIADLIGIFTNPRLLHPR